MRLAFVFPPQWDPRHPPLALSVLASAVEKSGNSARVWDFNLYLYQNLLMLNVCGSVEDVAMRKYMDPETLKDPYRFGQISSLLERVNCERYDSTGKNKLFWDALYCHLSPNKSQDWKTIVQGPGVLPFFRFINNEFDDLLKWNPDVVGISAISDNQILPALALASTIRMKLRARKLKIILGGDAFAYRRTLLGGLSWLFEVVDGICVADGEPVVKSLAEGVPLENIPNMVWFDGQKVHSPDNIQMHDFSHGSTHVFSMPTLADYLSPKLVIPVETARGCPWGKCAFCTHPFGSFAGKNCYNQKPIEIVKRELEFHIEMGFCDFFFVDEAIMPERLKKLSQIISEMKKEISWICYSRLDRHHSSEIFSIARKAGCKKIFWGLETGSERLLKLFRKGISPHLARNILLEAAQAKIASHLFLIGGFPDETDLDRTATLELIDSILPHIDPLSFTYDLFFLRCEIGTEFYNSPEKFGAQKVIHEDENDLAYQFDCVQNIQSKRTFENFQEEIARRVNRAFGNKFGLQNLHLSQDSLHLLLINSNRSLL